jgi:hypothetical protein
MSMQAPFSRSFGFASLLALTTAALLALAAIPASALAARGHVFKGSFGTPGSGPGQLKDPSAVAVNEASGASTQSISSAPAQARPSSPAISRLRSRVRGCSVVDQGNNRIEKFSAAGAFIRAFVPGLRTGAPA